jgi:hypothetical protein
MGDLGFIVVWPVSRPDGGPGERGGPSVPRGSRTVLSRHNLHRTYRDARVAEQALENHPNRSMLRVY